MHENESGDSEGSSNGGGDGDDGGLDDVEPMYNENNNTALMSLYPLLASVNVFAFTHYK